MNMKEIDELSKMIIGLAIEVHRNLGPGLLESTYQKCFAYELGLQNVDFVMEYPIQVKYKDIIIDCAFRADFIIANNIILELKSVEKIIPIHEAQLLTYMKLTGLKLGLIINFNEKLLKNGIKRMIL